MRIVNPSRKGRSGRVYQKYFVLLDEDGIYRAYESIYWCIPTRGESWPQKINIVYQTMSLRDAVYKSRELNKGIIDEMAG